MAGQKNSAEDVGVLYRGRMTCKWMTCAEGNACRGNDIFQSECRISPRSTPKQNSFEMKDPPSGLWFSSKLGADCVVTYRDEVLGNVPVNKLVTARLYSWKKLPAKWGRHFSLITLILLQTVKGDLRGRLLNSEAFGSRPEKRAVFVKLIDLGMPLNRKWIFKVSTIFHTLNSYWSCC